MSLVTVLVAVGLLGIVVAVLTTLFSNQFKMIKTIEQRGELEDLRNVVRNVLSCANTVEKLGPGTDCPGSPVAVYAHGSKARPFFPATPPFRKVGTYEIVASCSGKEVKAFQFHYVKGSSRKPLFAVPFNCPG